MLGPAVVLSLFHAWGPLWVPWLLVTAAIVFRETKRVLRSGTLCVKKVAVKCRKCFVLCVFFVV